MSDLKGKIEVIPIQNHFCNKGELISGMDGEEQRMAVIKKHDQSQAENLKQIEEKFAETPEQKLLREEKNAENIERIRTKIARREYDKIISGSTDEDKKGYYGFGKEIHAFKSAKATQEEKSEFRFTMVYGFGFITMMFLGFLSGYFIGSIVLGLDTTNSLILSIFVGTITMFMEAILMIIRIHQADKHREA